MYFVFDQNQICTPSCVLRSVSANCVVFCEWPVMISGLLALLSTGPSLELLLCLQLWHRHKILHAQYEEEENMRGTAPQGPLMSVVHVIWAPGFNLLFPVWSKKCSQELQTTHDKTWKLRPVWSCEKHRTRWICTNNFLMFTQLLTWFEKEKLLAYLKFAVSTN